MIRRLVALLSFYSAISFADIDINKKKFIAICAIFQNEAPYLKEWIEYHILNGVSQFFLYNNQSTDKFYHILKPYIDQQKVILKNWPSKEGAVHHCKAQLDAYNDCIKHYGNDFKWIAFIDIDEFFVTHTSANLEEYLHHFDQNPNIGAIGVNWQNFGTSHIKKLSKDSLVTESFYLKGQVDFACGRLLCNSTIKSIVRPYAVLQMYNHHASLKNGFRYYPIGPSGGDFWSCINRPISIDEIQLNHYWTRDEEFLYKIKIPRRKKVVGDKADILLDALDELNQVEDRSIQKFIPNLKQKMGLE